LLVDDRSSAVSLPETPLLGVLPGTGGLTRVVEKRKVRRDLADLFCTNADGVKGERAREWDWWMRFGRRQNLPRWCRERAQKLVAGRSGKRIRKASGLSALRRKIDERGYHYEHVDVTFDRAARTATVKVSGPKSETAEVGRRDSFAGRRVVAAGHGARAG